MRRQPAFFYDLASPDAYLAAERVVDVLGTVPEFVPVRIGGAERVPLRRGGGRSSAPRSSAARPPTGCCRCAGRPSSPADTDWAMLVATYAKQTGRVVAFSMAAFRQAFAAGRDLGDRDTVLIAAAAAEMHPAAVLKGAELRGTRARLDAATAAARAAGVRDVPAVLVGGRVFHGDRSSSGGARARGGARREGQPRVRADRAARRPRPAALADPGRVDQVEIVEIATGEVALFWDTAPAQTRPALARAQDRPGAARGGRVHAPLAALGAAVALTSRRAASASAARARRRSDSSMSGP